MLAIQNPISKTFCLLFAFTTLVFTPAVDAQNRSNVYGAIAFSPETVRYTYSVNKPSLNQAKSDALSACKKYGASDCTVVVDFHNNYCGAFAVTDANRSWGTAFGLKEQKSKIERGAVAACGRANRVATNPSPYPCYIANFICNDKY